MLHVGYTALTCCAQRRTLLYSDVGVFVGVEPSGIVARDSANVFSASGVALSITSGRLSFSLGLIGPCYSIDTACSSALAALHVCILTLRHQESTQAVGIGTKVLGERSNFATSTAGMTSLRGRCHTFDARADGYCRGEGSGSYHLLANTSTRHTGPVVVPEDSAV